MKKSIAGEKKRDFNKAVVILMKSGMTGYQVVKAMQCKHCGASPDKRNLYMTYEKYKEIYK